jgi:hypothetical protein
LMPQPRRANEPDALTRRCDSLVYRLGSRQRPLLRQWCQRRDFSCGLPSADWALLDVSWRRLAGLASLGFVALEDVVAHDLATDGHLLTREPNLSRLVSDVGTNTTEAATRDQPCWTTLLSSLLASHPCDDRLPSPKAHAARLLIQR